MYNILDMLLVSLKLIGLICGVLISLWLSLEILFWICLVFIGLSINRKKEYSSLNKFYIWWLYAFYKYMMIHARIRIHVTGIENVPFGTQYLFVSNHRSKFDHMIQSIILNKQYMAFISKPENFSIPIANRFIYRCLYLPIDRVNNREALKTVIKASDVLKQQSFSIGVFPEGTRSKDNNLIEYKPGCFKIAMKANAPIIVAATQGTENIKKNAPWKHTDIYVDIIKIFYPDDYKDKTTVDLSNEIYELTNQFIKNTNRI